MIVKCGKQLKVIKVKEKKISEVYRIKNVVINKEE